MACSAGPDIAESGLVLALDAADYNSFKGEVTTNLIPSPTINAYPTTGNGWGTYNTNQYNGAQYFSIGTINDVTNNIITTTTAHPLRTYDVVRAQTTGGGVTAGTDYFIKKISSTSFSLHAYNSSQDGSQGYINPATGTHKVYDSIATDTRISVNSTNFPTMWWGAPHQPNSGLVKELRYGEFNAIPNLPSNDCIRLHYIRTDDVKDGMSYGVDCTVTPGSPVTISFYTRSANANAVGKVVQYYIYNYTGGSATDYSWNFTLGQVGVWERQTFTYTPAYGTMISYWFPQSGGVYAWDWSCMQVEQKSYVTNFVAGTRGSTVATGGGWADLIGNGNHGELVNGVKESSDKLGALVFDGSDDYINCGSNSSLGLGALTLSAWVKASPDVSNYRAIIADESSGGAPWNYRLYLRIGDGHVIFDVNGGGYSGVSSTYAINNNQWYHICAVRTSPGGTQNLYINGILNNSGSDATSITTVANAVWIGQSPYNNGSYPFNGNIASVKIYNRALSAQEVQQNFNMMRGRFGI